MEMGGIFFKNLEFYPPPTIRFGRVIVILIFLVVTTRYLVVTARYLVVTGGCYPLLVVTACYRSFPLFV